MNQQDIKPIAVYETTKWVVDTSEKKFFIFNHIKKLKIVLSVYDTPIHKTNTKRFYTKFVIMDGNQEWGHGILEAPVADTSAQRTLKEIRNNIFMFKNPS